MVKGKKVALYCRVARKDVLALEHQIWRVAQFALGRGYSVGRIYQDNGVNGATVDRPAFNCLMRDMLAGKIDVIVVNDLSRIARNFILVDCWLAMANALGVEVISLAGDIDSLTSIEQLRELMLMVSEATGEQ